MSKSYFVIGAILVAGIVWVKTSEPYRDRKAAMDAQNYEQVVNPGETISDEGLGWTCTRSNANGSGTVPCQMIIEPNRITYSFADSAQITFHVQNADANGIQEVSGVQVEQANREPAFGFCEKRGEGIRCEASNGQQMVEYEAR